MPPIELNRPPRCSLLWIFLSQKNGRDERGLARSELSWVSGGSVLLWNEWAHGGREHCIAGPNRESVLEFGWAESQAHKWICAAAETAAQIMTQGKKPPEKLEVLGETEWKE